MGIRRFVVSVLEAVCSKPSILNTGQIKPLSFGHSQNQLSYHSKEINIYPKAEFQFLSNDSKKAQLHLLNLLSNPLHRKRMQGLTQGKGNRKDGIAHTIKKWL